MNKFTALAFTIALSLGWATTSFSANMNDAAPQVRDLNAQEISSVIGAGRIYWRTRSPRTWVSQNDSPYHRPHRARFPQGDIGRHNIPTGQRVVVQCRGYRLFQAIFRMPRYSIGISC